MTPLFTTARVGAGKRIASGTEKTSVASADPTGYRAAPILARQSATYGGETMKRRCLVAFGLLLGLGCATDSDKGQWAEVWKDLRGDNMKMMADRDRPSDQTASTKARD
jgi:hypothetical protein